MAALTLGKDMTFRDYAQGAYRMRGIGKGQTIELLVVPEVQMLIDAQMALGSGKTAEDRQREVRSLSPEAQARRPLRDVAGWLHVNSMRMEHLQFNLLQEQSVKNVWRKVAFRSLAERHGAVGTGSEDEWLRSCINVFRESIDHKVASPIELSHGAPHGAPHDPT